MAAQQRLVNMANMFSMGMRSSPVGTFASTPVLGFRSMSTLGARSNLFTPKGLGLGLASRPTIPAAGPVRSLTDGQILGNSFMLATDVSVRMLALRACKPALVMCMTCSGSSRSDCICCTDVAISEPQGHGRHAGIVLCACCCTLRQSSEGIRCMDHMIQHKAWL